jgi:hypothetical protein
MWAGLQLQADDLPGTSAGSYYPLPLIRALALAWLFSGLRSDEISRLRVGCIRWQQDGHRIAGDSKEVLAQDAVCLLDVPVHKTGTAFTKPVDPLVGQAIEAWLALSTGIGPAVLLGVGPTRVGGAVDGSPLSWPRLLSGAAGLFGGCERVGGELSDLVGVGGVAEGVLVGDPGEQFGLVGEERGPLGRVVAAAVGAQVGEVVEESGKVVDGDVVVVVDGVVVGHGVVLSRSRRPA